jgi:hypothetical protein
MIPIGYPPRIDRPHAAMIFCAPRGPLLATEVAMGMERWKPKREATRQEEFLLKRLHRTRKLFGFLRRHRHELFDDEFQAELESMYRKTGAGDDPVPPALLATVVLLQSYLGTSDAEAVELAVVDLRWQMVLGCLGATEPPFSQGALPAFRERLIAHDMDRRLLERTVELARATKEFDWSATRKGWSEGRKRCDSSRNSVLSSSGGSSRPRGPSPATRKRALRRSPATETAMRRHAST